MPLTPPTRNTMCCACARRTAVICMLAHVLCGLCLERLRASLLGPGRAGYDDRVVDLSDEGLGLRKGAA